MSADDSQSETASPGDIREELMARHQEEVFHTVKGFAYLFFGLQAYPLILFSLEVVLRVPGLIEFLLGTIAIVLLFVSAIVSLFTAVSTLRNAPVLEWWMIALGVLPWMVIATEVTFTLLFAWL